MWLAVLEHVEWSITPEKCHINTNPSVQSVAKSSRSQKNINHDADIITLSSYRLPIIPLSFLFYFAIILSFSQQSQKQGQLKVNR